MREINFKVNLTYGDKSLSDSDKSSLYYMFLFWGIIMPNIVFFGLIGNALTMLVLFRREMRSPTIYYLRALVISDTIILLTAFLLLSMYGLSLYAKGLNYYEQFVFPSIFKPIEYISLVTQTCNVWITVSVSVERYVSICHPFQSTKIVTKVSTLIVIAVVCVVSVLYNIPRLFAKVCEPCKDNTCNILKSTEFSLSQSYMVYQTYIYIVVMFVIPLLSLIIINCLIIIELMNMRRRQRHTNIQSDDEANLSLALVLIVVVFVLCQTLALIAQFDTILPPNEFIKFLAISNTMVVVNSAVNFPIYLGVGRKFRTLLGQMIQSVCLPKRSIRSPRRSLTTNGFSRRTSLTDFERSDHNAVVKLLNPQGDTRL